MCVCVCVCMCVCVCVCVCVQPRGTNPALLIDRSKQPQLVSTNPMANLFNYWIDGADLVETSINCRYAC